MFNYLKKNKDISQQGNVLPTVLVLMLFLSLLGIAISSLAVSQYEITSDSNFRANSLFTAEAGVEQTIKTLNTNDSFLGFSDPQVFFNNQKQGRGQFVTTVTKPAGSDNAKVITSTATVYAYNTNVIKSKQAVKVTTVGTSSNGFSVHTGPGGLILGGSANITNSDVYVNGYIQMDGASKIGTNDFPVQVQVAHNSCPAGTNPGSAYPSVCTTGQPITMAYSTTIYGSVCATNQTSLGPRPGGNILKGVDGEGLKNGCVAPVVPTPSYDRNAHITRMTSTGNGSDNLYVCKKWPFDRSWPANLKLTGNVSISSSCELVVNGDVYITGDFTLGGAAKIKVSDSVGTNRPVIVVDGNVNIGGSGGILTNSSGTGIKIISFKTNANCNPSCTSLTGTPLKNSQGLETVSIGGAVNLPGMIFQSYWGKIKVDGSGNIGAAIGQTVDLSGAGTVTFGTEVSSGSRTWTITSYQRKY